MARANPCWQTRGSVWHNQGVAVTNSRSRTARSIAGGAQRGARDGPRPAPPPLDAEALQRLALHYVGKYATSRGKLADYLRRKLRERGWIGDVPPDLAALCERFAELGYVDDQAFAAGRARSLGAHGYGKRRVRAALQAAGIGEEDAAPANEIADEGRWAAALRYAQKRRIGPWARAEPDRAGREKAIGAMIRAGHDFATARAIVAASPGEVPDDVSI